MTQIIPHFNDIKFSKSHNIYKQDKKGELFVKHKNPILAVINSAINKLFGTSSITEQNISIVLNCAIKNIDNVNCSLPELLEAVKTIEEIDNATRTPENKAQITLLKQKLDYKLVLKSEASLPKTFTSHIDSVKVIKEGIFADYKRADDTYYEEIPLKELPINNLDLHMRAVLLSSFQSFETPRESIGSLFVLSKQGKANPCMIRKYEITNLNKGVITISAEVSWLDKKNDNKEMLNLKYDIKMDVKKINAIFDSQDTDGSIKINPVTETKIKSVNIGDRSLFKYISPLIATIKSH